MSRSFDESNGFTVFFDPGSVVFVYIYPKLKLVRASHEQAVLCSSRTGVFAGTDVDLKDRSPAWSAYHQKVSLHPGSGEEGLRRL
jgi:hypothetical protein